MPLRLTVLAYPALSDEPVSLALLKAQVREDSTAPEVLDLLTLKLQAARDLCERHCGRLFASATVAHTFEVGEPYERLPGAGIATAVTGYYTDLTDLDKLTGTSYQAEYWKGIGVSRDYPIGYEFTSYGYRREQPTLTVTYPVVLPAAACPPAVKEAILKLAAELYENRETTAAVRDVLLAVSYRTLLAPYVLLNPIYQL